MVVNFEYLKKEVSLPDFFYKLGWEKANGSTSGSPKFTNGTLTVVVKKNKNGEYTYWNVHDYSDRGKNILDLMRQHIYEETGRLPSIREAGEAIQTYVNCGEIVLTKNSTFDVSNAELDENSLANLLNSLKPYNGDFLSKRGISPEILSSPVFSDVIFSRIYKKDGKSYNNTCIKLINASGFKGISQRAIKDNNQSFKGILGYKYGSIATSKHDNSRPLDLVLVGESFIDNMSHYQMKYQNTDKNILYISTEGNLTKGQIELIAQLISKQNINIDTQLVYIFDNDHNGYRYALELEGYLRTQEVPDLKGLTTEQLRDKVLKLPNVDLPINKDHNEDLQAYIYKEKEEKFQEAIKKNDYTKIFELKEEGFIPSMKMIERLQRDSKIFIALQKIFNLPIDTPKLDTVNSIQNSELKQIQTCQQTL